MTTIERSEYTVRHFAFRVPSGIFAGDLTAVWNSALAEYGQLAGLPEGGEVPPNWATVTADGDTIVLHFEVREDRTGGPR